VETLTGVVRRGKAQVELDPETVGRIIGGLAGGAVGARIGREIGRFFVRVSSAGCEEVQSAVVEIEEKPAQEEPARVEQLTTREVAALQRGRSVRELVDILSGKSFNISWEASANYHTDWNPATPADTAIVKSIINPNGNNIDWTNPGSWPYFRPRPGVLKLNGRLIAVGIHLYPHDIVMSENPGPPLSNQQGRRITAAEARSWGLGATWEGKWYLGGHMCMYYGDSPSGRGEITTGFAKRMNDAARDAYSRGL